MIKALLRFTRALVGLWAEVRKLRLLLEWLACNGLTLSGTVGEQRVNIMFQPIYLPPTSKEIAEAEKEKLEYGELVPEEERAAERAAELFKRRAKGETIPEDEAGSDFELY